MRIAIPEAKGKLVIKKKGKASYVLYEYDRVYHKDKGYTIPKRAIIGKVSGKDPSQMFPNEKYEIYFPGAVVPEELPEAKRSCCLRIGAHLVIRSVLEEYKIPSILEKYFQEDTGLLLDLVSYLLINEENTGQHYPDYAFCHPLFTPDMHIYSDVTVSRLLYSLQQEQTLGFLDDWNKGVDRRQRIYVSYDSTNKNCQAGDIDLVEFGKAKEERGLPVFNLSLAFDKTNRIPLFYETNPSSITDVSQLTCMVDKVAEREQLEGKIDCLSQFLKKQEGRGLKVGKTYTDYFKLHYSKEGKLFYAEERADVIQRALGLCGYFCLVSSEKMAAEEAIVLYKG